LIVEKLRQSETVSEVLVWPLRHLGITLAIGVARNEAGARRIAVDGASRTTVNFDELLRQEGRARRLAQGALTDRLAEELALSTADEEFQADITVASAIAPSTTPYDGRDLAVPVEILNAHAISENLRIRAGLDIAKAPLLAWLHSTGVAFENYPGLPIVRVRGNRDVLLSPRLHQDDIEAIDLPEPKGSLAGYAGHGAMKDASFIGGLCGTSCAGASLPIGITELNTAPIGIRTGIARLNGRLSIGSVVYREAPSNCTTDTQCWDTSTGEPNENKCVAGKCVGFHLSTVAASVGMAFDYTYPAGALGPSSVAFPANGAYEVSRYIAVTGNAQMDISWLTNDTPVRHINRSASASPAELNWAARVPAVMSFLPAGNVVIGPIIANGVVWNALNVGMYNYETWDIASSHRVNTLSCWQNDPGQPGQELPHVVGPGAHTDSTQSGGGIHTASLTFTGSPTSAQGMMNQVPIPSGLGAQIKGTSFSTPAVMGAAIQAYQYEGGFSQMYFPIVKRAVLMAATTDGNADGRVGLGNEWTSGGDAKDGAGQIDLALSKQVLDGNQYTRIDLTDASFTSCGTGCREFALPSIPNPTSIGIKAVLTWNSCGNTPPTDLDLVLIRPSTCGGINQSTSLNNNVEAVYAFCAGVSRSKYYGVRIRIKNGGTLPLCNGETTEPVALAWSYQ